MRCITMLKIHEPMRNVFNTVQCRNHTFGTHDFCKACLKRAVWKSQSRICAVRACAASPTGGSIENEADAHLLYPQKEYGKGVYNRMHVVCESCFHRYIREGKKRTIQPKMFWVTLERYNEIEAELLDWINQQYPVPGKAEVQRKRFGLYRNERKRFRKSAAFQPIHSVTARCDDCRCETYADQLHISQHTDGEGLCWVCKENRLWALDIHPGTGRSRGLLSRLKSFFKRIDTYRKVVPISLDQECDLMDIINYLTPKVSRSSPKYMSQRVIRKRWLVIDWWYAFECPSCRRVVEESQWVVDWKKDLAGCKSCHMAGWSKPFKDAVVPFGLAFDEK